MSKLKFVYLAVAILGTGVYGCKTLLPFTKQIDAICVAGRISQEQADALNSISWEAGGDRLPAKVNDRVLRMECSECLKSFSQGKGRGDRSQCHIFVHPDHELHK